MLQQGLLRPVVNAMKTELDEVADNMREEWTAFLFMFPSMKKGNIMECARMFAEERMPGETPQVVDGVAESLVRGTL